MNKYKKFGLFTTLACGFLAGVMATDPLELQAAAQGPYISDVIVITENDIESAETDGYTVMDMPLGEQSLRADKTGTSFTKTYLAYKTTKDTKEAIREMKFMNMNGGFDFAKYDQYLDNIETETKENVGQLFTAIEGFRKYYKAETAQGKFAYDALNIFYYNENDGFDSQIVNKYIVNNATIKNGESKKKLGDLFLDETLIPNGDSKILTDIFMEGNAYAVNSIYSMLNIANIKDDNGKTVFDNLEDNKNNFESFSDRTDLNDVFAKFSADFIRIRDEVSWYKTSATRKYEDFADINEALAYSFSLANDDVNNQTNYADMWNNAAKEIPFLEGIKYKGLSGKYNNLLELIMDEEAEANEYYPLLGCMSPGVRSTALIGIIDTLTNSLLDETKYSERLDGLKNADDFANKALTKDGISVFYGVDRALFQKGNVAMTTSAQEGAARGDESWMQTNSENIKNSQTTEILEYVSIGCAGLVVLSGIGWVTCRGLYSAALQTISNVRDKLITGFVGEAKDYIITDIGDKILYQRIIDKSAECLVAENNLTNVTVKEVADACKCPEILQNNTLFASRQTAFVAQDVLPVVKIVMATMVIIALVALIVTVVLYVLNHSKLKKEVFSKYAEIPGILCHYQPVYDISSSGLRTISKDNGYVYYYGARNPYTVVTKAKYGDEDTGTFDLGENKRNVQDIFNWELGAGKSREWVCLYYTKDSRANYPITTSSLKLLNEVGETVLGASYFNNPSIEYNVNTVLINNYYDDKNIKSDTKSISETPQKYIRYDYRKVRESTTMGSIVASPATWGFIIAGLGLGFGGGFLTFHLIDKKKKKINGNA